jgi:hypothetical protein
VRYEFWPEPSAEEREVLAQALREEEDAAGPAAYLSRWRRSGLSGRAAPEDSRRDARVIESGDPGQDECDE